MKRKILKFAEGFGPIYKDGKIAPGYEGLGPKRQKDLGPLKKMPKSPRKIKPNKWKGTPEKFYPGKKYYA